MGLINSILVERITKEKRFSICSECEFLKNGFCGTPIKGETVKVKRKGKEKLVKLCGCNMWIKTGLKMSKCPVGKWGRAELEKGEITFVNDVKKLLAELEGKKTIETDEVKEIFKFHNPVIGSKIKNSNCVPCVRAAIEDLKQWVNSTE